MLTSPNTLKYNKKENINMNLNSQDSTHKKPFVRKPSTNLLLNNSRNKRSDSPPRNDKQPINTQSRVRVVKN